MVDYSKVTNKACFEIQSKVKSKGTLNSLMNHNARLERVENADPERMQYNEELVEEYARDNIFSLSTEQERKEKVVSFSDRFDKRISELEYYQTHTVHSNAVLAYNISLTYSPTAQLSVEEWKKANYEFLKEEFNVSPDGGNNVISCIFHGDENNGHIHAVVMPVNEKGKLSAKSFTDGWSAMVQYQDRYGKAMERFGLERGTHGSQMEHTQVRKFYAEANKVLESTPKPLPGESAQEYFDRYREQLETAQASQYLKTKRICEEQKRQMDAYVQEQRQNLKIQMAKEKEQIKLDSDTLKAKERRLSEKEKIFETRYTQIENKKDELLLDIDKLQQLKKDLEHELSDVSRKVKNYDDTLQAYQILRKRNPELASQYDDIINEMDEITQEIEAGDIDPSDYIDN